MTSELSNALNPHIVQQRRRRPAYPPRDQYASTSAPEPPRPAPAPPPPQPYTRHRSELELAVVEPPPPPPPPRPTAQPPAVTRTINPLQELVRAVVNTRQAAEQERSRRLAWEQEQEAKYVQRQAELEQQLADVKSEMSLLKAVVSMQQQQQQSYQPSQSQMMPQNHVMMPPEPMPPQPPLPALAAHIEEVPVQLTSPHSDQDSYPFDWSASPSRQSPANGRPPPVPAFIEGSSSRPLPAYNYNANSSFSYSSSTIASPSDGWVQSPSPSVFSPAAATEASSSAMSPPSSTLGKRRTPPPESPPIDSHNDESSADESDAPAGSGRRRRKNGHDDRCLTIQSALRKHIYRCMLTWPNDPLPEGHPEGVRLGDDEPVRFNWAKTTRKSKHNALMKKRVINDLLANRKLYKHVPEKDFSEKMLETVFDQAFTTLRQKFKTQQDEAAAMHARWREEQKAMKARRKERKKNKLAARQESRTHLPMYTHPTFDSALQLECMSSEESESEYTAPAPSGQVNRVHVLRVRTLPWRSTRLLRLFAALDVAVPASPAAPPSPAPFPAGPGEPQQKRRRGTSAVKERCLGPPKDGLHLPPRGVPRWMVSRGWLRECTESGQADVEERVEELIDDENDAGFDWERFHILGEETDEEPAQPVPEQYIPRSDTSYALANALQAPM